MLKPGLGHERCQHGAEIDRGMTDELADNGSFWMVSRSPCRTVPLQNFFAVNPCGWRVDPDGRERKGAWTETPLNRELGPQTLSYVSSSWDIVAQWRSYHQQCHPHFRRCNPGASIGGSASKLDLTCPSLCQSSAYHPLATSPHTRVEPISALE